MLIGANQLPADVVTPDDAVGVVIFAHGSGSSRRSPRNRLVAQALNQAGLATVLFDLLTDDETDDRRNVFDIPLLGERVVEAVRCTQARHGLIGLPIGVFGASTGAAAALVAAARIGDEIGAVVSRGGRPDLASGVLDQVRAPTLLIVGSRDAAVMELNATAVAMMRCTRRLEVVSGATHLFEEPGALEQVVRLATAWFILHLTQGRSR